MTLEKCATHWIEHASRWGLQCITPTMEPELFPSRQGHKNHLRPKLTANMRVRDGSIWFNADATSWLGDLKNVHLIIKEHYNWYMKRASAAEGRLWKLPNRYVVMSVGWRAVQIACIWAVALYGSKLWWDPKALGRQDDPKLLLNQQARSRLGVLCTTPQRAPMREAGLTPTPVISDSRQQWFTARLANAYSNEGKTLHQTPSSGELICRVVNNENGHGYTTDGMNWPTSGEESVVRTIILDNKSAANRYVQRRKWGRSKCRPRDLNLVDQWIALQWWLSGSHSNISSRKRIEVLPQHSG